MNSKTTVKTSTEMLFSPPPAQWHIGVSQGEWNALRRKIERIHSGNRILASLGPFIWGAAASFLSSAALQGKSALPWGLFAAALACAAVWTVASHDKRELSAQRKEDVLEEMDRLKEAWIPGPKASAGSSSVVLTGIMPR